MTNDTTAIAPAPESAYAIDIETNRKHGSSAIRNPTVTEAMEAMVALWHAGAGKTQSLQQFLGLTWAQYGVWVQSQELPPGYVPPILTDPPAENLQQVATLEGRDLNYWTALASGRWDEGWLERHRHTESVPKLSTDFGEGGPLLGEFAIDFEYDHDVQLSGGNGYCAMVFDFNQPIEGYRGHFALRAKGFGRDHLVAACRALVASVYGPVVPI